MSGPAKRGNRFALLPLIGEYDMSGCIDHAAMFLNEHNQHLRSTWAAFAEPGDRNNRDRSAVVVLMLFDKSSGRGLQRRATLATGRSES